MAHSTLNDIVCPCGEPCGKKYPATWDDPGFREGKGENFIVDGVWHCSQECADKTLAEATHVD